MLGGRFILLFFASVCFLLFRCFLFSLTIRIGLDIAYDPLTDNYEFTYDIGLFFSLLAVQVMPQLFLSLYSTIGFSKDSLKLISQHPSLLLISSGTKPLILPKILYFKFLVTFFTFAKNSTMCGSQDLKIRLSRRYTFINFGVSTLASAYVYYRTVLNGEINSEG